MLGSPTDPRESKRMMQTSAGSGRSARECTFKVFSPECTENTLAPNPQLPEVTLIRHILCIHVKFELHDENRYFSHFIRSYASSLLGIDKTIPESRYVASIYSIENEKDNKKKTKKKEKRRAATQPTLSVPSQPVERQLGK